MMKIPASVNGVAYDPEYREVGWTYPDSCEEGLPCALASLIAAYAGEDLQGCVGWCQNIASRLWLGAMVDYRYSEAVCIENLHKVVSKAAGALVLAGSGYADYVPEPHEYSALVETGFHKAVIDLAKAMEPHGEFDMYRRVYPVAIDRLDDGIDWGRVKCAAMSLRYLWLARLHEANRRWSPDCDFEVSHSWARMALPDIYKSGGVVRYVPALHEVIGEAFRADRVPEKSQW